MASRSNEEFRGRESAMMFEEGHVRDTWISRFLDKEKDKMHNGYQF